MAYDWSPEEIVDFGNLFRELCPDGYLGIEHTPGHIPVGEGGSDWAPGGRMQCYDVVLSEFFWPTTGGQVWQVVARLNRPYHTPPDQKQALANGPSDPNYDAANDANPPFYLKDPTPRGPVSYVPFEYATYQWTRGQVTKEQVQQARAYFYSLGCTNVC